MPSDSTLATGETSLRRPPIPGGQAAPLTPYLLQHQRQRRFTALTATAAKGAVKRGAFTYRLGWCRSRWPRPPPGLLPTLLPHRSLRSPAISWVLGFRHVGKALFICCLGNNYSRALRRSEILGIAPRIGEAPAELCFPKCVSLPDKI